MALIALVIKRYNELFKEEVFNFSDEYKVDFDFETNEIKIDNNHDYIENFYGKSIYNISPIVGINGTGKTTVLNIIGDYTPAKSEKDRNNQYFFLFELGKHEDKVRFKVFSTNLSVATLLENGEQTFYRNQDGSFECDPEYYEFTKNILYVNLPSKGKGGGVEYHRTTLNQKGLAMFIHSYLWLSDRKIISSVLTCSLDISPYGLKGYADSIPRGINAIGFLIYKSIHNIFDEKEEFIKKLLSKSLMTECERYLKEDVSDYENSGFNLILEIVKELEQNEVIDDGDKSENNFGKVRKEYVESIVSLIDCFKKLRNLGNLTEYDNVTLLLNYSENNKHIFEELNKNLLIM